MILVTGSTGLVGSHLIFDLLNQGQQVKALVQKSSDKSCILQTFRLYSPNPDELFNKIIWTEGDITDILSLEEAFTDVHQVYHTAALVSFNPKDKKKIYQVNIEGTANVVNLCLEKNIGKLCFVSSIAALGVTEDGSDISEDVFWKPAKNYSPYSISKYKAEMEVWRGITEGLNAVMVNPSVILGPGNCKKNNASFYKLIAKGLPFYTLGITGFVDVRDVTKAMIILMNSETTGERFVLSAGNISYKLLFEMIADTLHVKPPKIYISRWMAEIAWRLEYIKALVFFVSPGITKNTVEISYKKLLYSSEKIKNRFHFEFRPLAETIKEFGLQHQK